MRHLWIVMGLLTLTTAAGLMGAQAASKARPVSVAVVDIKRLFESLQEKNQIEADLNSRRQKLADESNRRKAELEQMKSDLETVLQPNTPAYNEKQNEMERKAIDFQAWVQYQNNRLARENVLQSESLYLRMSDAIGQVAKDNGYDMVLFKEREVSFSGAKPEQLTALIQGRKVLWASDDLDVTDLVIQKMNNEFKSRPAASGR